MINLLVNTHGILIMRTDKTTLVENLRIDSNIIIILILLLKNINNVLVNGRSGVFICSKKAITK